MLLLWVAAVDPSDPEPLIGLGSPTWDCSGLRQQNSW